MKKITDILYYSLAFFLAFGSVNPFRIGEVSNQIMDQQGLSPYIFIGCIILTVLNRGIHNNIIAKKTFYTPLILMSIIFFASSLIWNFESTFNYLDFFAKLLIGIVGFVCISAYLEVYPDVLKKSILIYAYTCAAIILLFFIGRLDSLSYYSNGRLWIFGINPNTFSFMMGLGALYLADELLNNKTRITFTIINSTSIVLIFLYILLSGSRGTLLFILLSLGILFLPYLKKRWYAILPLVFIMYYASFQVLQSNTNEITIVERMSSITQEDDREGLLSNALTLFTESPLWGLGRNGYVEQRLERFHDFRDSHNILMSIMVMGGLMALLCYLLYTQLLFAHSIRQYKN